MTPTAVVFDCDGVLVDSEPHSRSSWVEVLERLEHPGTASDVAECIGLGFVSTRAALERLAPLPSPETLWPMLMEALSGSYSRDGLEVFDDSIATLDRVVEMGLPHAVASASPRERLDLTLHTAGLGDRFAVSVAGDEVARGKPAPDGYLSALDDLGIDHTGVIAIEDSAMGVQSALSAGLEVIAVAREPQHRTDLEALGVLVVDRVTPEVLGL